MHFGFKTIIKSDSYYDFREPIFPRIQPLEGLYRFFFVKTLHIQIDI